MNAESLDARALWADIAAIRERAPLVVNVTNAVVTNTTANALLALGASPAMSHAAEEMPELVALASALVINPGTPGAEQIEGMRASLETAVKLGKPWVLDPVAAGATNLRTGLCREFLERYRPSVIRGNASEIMAVAGEAGKPKGVDSSQSVDQAQAAGRSLAERFGCVAQISGESDLVLDVQRAVRLFGGHAMMTKVTGLGCTATAITGAFLAVNPDPWLAAAHGAVVMNVAGELAAAKAQGPGTLQLHFCDVLYNLTEAQVAAGLRQEVL